MIKVYTAGTWDLFHVGHLNILKRSKELGDYLVVAVSTDSLIRSYKDKRPIVLLEDRLAIIKACKYVDEVIVQHKLLDPKVLDRINPDIITIGSDWKSKHLDGLEYFKTKGQVIYFDYTKGVSTTMLINRVIEQQQG